MNKFIKIMLMACVVFALTVSGCISAPVQDNSPDTQKTAPTVKLDTSLERDLINEWLKEVGDPNNIMWLYHMSETGQILGEYPIVGKAVSMSKSNEPYERVLDTYNGGPDYDEVSAAERFEGYRPGTPQLANPSGTYGHDLEGVFFFTPDGEYHEIHGGIIHVSSVPIKINDPMFLTYDIDKEKQQKEKMWEAELKNGSKV